MTVTDHDEQGIQTLCLRLGQRVRRKRAARAMTMKQLAAESDISLPYLSRVEKGDGNVSISVLQRLARALNVSMDSLLSDQDEYGVDYALIVELLKRQTPDSLREIRSHLVETLGQGKTHCTGAPHRIALIGLRGAGKSSTGPLLSHALGIPFVELNALVAERAGMPLSEFFSIYGQSGFRRLERDCLEQVIAHYPQVIIATGGGIVAEPATYELLLHSFFVCWLHATPEVHFQRVMKQHDARIATPALRDEAMANILASLEARCKLYALAHAQVDTTHLTAEQVAKQMLIQLQRTR
ncbi:helix-turn-helix transcriptional regulator [Neopusillimonas maritima]|uniref:Shikimate kinase n=1 Tax=Neopusillimonas maritima TaxID=2026239 RepID=A0A3A1YR28_9BURK|nr:helix-turn-helix transcriptional regulator [Neopusillimonas maritima]RIY39628.1 transcriptional regulator [Neopusillimonas maritima]